MQIIVKTGPIRVEIELGPDNTFTANESLPESIQGTVIASVKLLKDGVQVMPSEVGYPQFDYLFVPATKTAINVSVADFKSIFSQMKW